MKKVQISKIKMVGLLIFLLLTISTPVFAAEAYPTVSYYPELEKIVRLIQFFINIIRWGASIIAGLVVAVTGWQMIMSNQGLEVAKKNFKNAVIAFVFIFGCNIIGGFMVGKFIEILLG
jgi:hypothetical protein